MRKDKYSKLVYSDYSYIGKKRRFKYKEELENLIQNFPKSMKKKHVIDNGQIVLEERTNEEIRELLERDYKEKGRKSLIYRIFKEKEYTSFVNIEYYTYINDLEYSHSGKSFLQLYENEIVTYKINGKEISTSIRTALNYYAEGKISREDMNKILYEFKRKSTKYKTAGSS